jgi:hypothetical protein
MDHKTAIHQQLRACADILLSYIKGIEPGYSDRWVPIADIKHSLELNFVAVPKANTPRGEKGWFFAILARMLEDRRLLEYDRRGSRSYCRSRTQRTA